VRSALQLVAKRRAELNQASLPPNPTIGLGIGIAVDGLSGAPALVQVLEHLSWLWTRPHRMNQADAARRGSILAAADVAIVLAAEVRSAHTVALGAHHQVALDEQFAETTERTTSLVQRLAEVGETSQTEVALALLDHAQALAAVAASRQNLVASKLALLAVMGVPAAGTDFDVVGSLKRLAAVPTDEDVVRRAVIARLDVAAAREKVAVAAAQAGLAETRRYPTLDVGLGWQQNFNDRHALVPMITVGLPVFDDGSTAIDSANADIRIASLALVAAERSAVADARGARQRWEQSLEQATLYEETVLAPAIHAQELLERAYAEGVNDLTMLLKATRRRIAAERQLLHHQTNVSIHLVALERAVGGSFEIPIAAPNEPPNTAPPEEETTS
jgi:outer membrane protein TolC